MGDDLRDLLTQALDEAVQYRARLAGARAAPELGYHEVRETVRAPLPETPAAASEVIAELIVRAEPGLMPMAGPRFFGFVIGASHPAGVAADWLVSAWGQNAGYQSPTPSAAAIEEIAEGWLLDILDLPRESRIGFTTGATVANAVGLAAARTRLLLDAGWDPDAQGLFGAPEVTVLLGADAHSSVFSALQLIGFGYRRAIRIATDDQGRMQPGALEAEIGKHEGPKLVIAQAGQINTGAFDPFGEIVRIAKRAGAWVHVDGAFGLWARATPGRRQLTEGVEGADSWVTDGHKWLQVPYDCGFAIVRDREAHQRAMTQWSSYLPAYSADDRVPSAYVPELSRRARGIPVWAMLKTLGRRGVAELVERHCRFAERFAERLAEEPGIRVLNAPAINQTIVSFGNGAAEANRAATDAVIAGVQHDGVCFVGGADWHGERVLRISVSSGETTEADVDRSAEAIIAAWRTVRQGM
jgi:glutamate/tyrosine decarboxylase-like PLP-dependent enzyme